MAHTTDDPHWIFGPDIADDAVLSGDWCRYVTDIEAPQWQIPGTPGQPCTPCTPGTSKQGWYRLDFLASRGTMMSQGLAEHLATSAKWKDYTSFKHTWRMPRNTKAPLKVTTPDKWSCSHKRIVTDMQCPVCKAFGRQPVTT